MTGLKAQLNRKLHECGRDPLSLFLLGCVIAAALITFMVLSFLLYSLDWLHTSTKHISFHHR